MVASAGFPLSLLAIVLALWWAISAALWGRPKRRAGGEMAASSC